MATNPQSDAGYWEYSEADAIRIRVAGKAPGYGGDGSMNFNPQGADGPREVRKERRDER